MWASSANFSLPRPLLLISKTAKLHAYIRQNVDIIPVSSVNVITVVVYHFRNKNTFMTDAFHVQYRCRCILLLSAIYE